MSDLIVKEYMGVEVLRNGCILEHRDDLFMGDEVMVAGLFGEDYQMTVQDKDEDGTMYAYARPGKKGLCALFDDRQCWVSTGLLNADAIQKLRLDLDKE